LAEREAAVLAGEQASRLRLDEVNQREVAADRRDHLADRREAATTRREGAAKASARASVQLRRVNERLVLSTVDAQNRTEAAEQVSAAMSRAARHDFLTGLANRSLLAERLEQALGEDREGALLFLDLDHFKEVNDTLGHPAGDLLLRSIARRLEACVRQTDTVCRLGGDEFLLLLPDAGKAEGAVLTARKVIATLAPPHLIGGREVSVTASIGISCFPGDGAGPEALVEAADLAMYQAKRQGRNGFQVYAKSLARPPGRRRRAARS
jgi:diguanylate cyclase (GGDEF)-like protein